MSEATKHDDGKPRWSLLPLDAVTEVVKVYTHGAAKYGDRNWEAGTRWSRFFDAAQRHQAAFWQGETLDGESKLYHLAAAIFNLLALLAYQIRGIGIDDRPQISGTKDAMDYCDSCERYHSKFVACAPVTEGGKS